jgi:hypothetical protein
MVKIKDFIEKGFKITWTLIDLGFEGSAKFEKQLDGQDIIDYAVGRVEKGDDTFEAVLLAGLPSPKDEEINSLLKHLSKNEKVDCDVEFRKWRVIYVLKHLPNTKDEYIQGLIELGDIWAKFDFPDDSPHVFQGRNNLITPEKYYTKENYEKLLENHKKWLDKEVADLKQLTL